MTDVRLTALNPEDSKVYPVACNSSGELLTTKSDDINLDVPGDLTVGGTGTFKRNVNVGDTSTSSGGIQISAAGYLYLRSAGADAGTPVIDVYDLNNTKSAGINADGSIVTRSSISAAAGYSGIDASGTIYAARNNEGEILFNGAPYGKEATSTINAAGGCMFASDVVVGSRGAKWLIRESNGVAMLIEQTVRGAKEPRIEEVRDLPRELDLIEGALSEIMEKLKMTPPAGWPVWDGETE